MDLLQRIQRWYTLNCNGDWEHSYGLSIWHGISIQTLDNPGWIVDIDLQETCLQDALLPYSLTDRSPADWVGYSTEDGKFKAAGGPENLSEILAYFLDSFIPQHIDPEFLLDLHLPVVGYENGLLLKAKAKMLSASTVEIVSIADPQLPVSYKWGLDTELDLLWRLEDQLVDLKTAFVIGNEVDPYVFQTEDNTLRTFLAAPTIS